MARFVLIDTSTVTFMYPSDFDLEALGSVVDSLSKS